MKHRTCQSLQDRFRKHIHKKIHLQLTTNQKHYPFSRQQLELFPTFIKTPIKHNTNSPIGSLITQTSHSEESDIAIVKMMLSNKKENWKQLQSWIKVHNDLVSNASQAQIN